MRDDFRVISVRIQCLAGSQKALLLKSRRDFLPKYDK